MERPSYDELADLVVALQRQVASLTSEMATMRENYERQISDLHTENTALKARVAELEAKLATNSRNSSKPPSSDGPDAPKPRSLRGKSGRRPGGQVGHPGSTLRQVADPDEIVRHQPRACGSCGAGLAGAKETGTVRRQVFDIPPVKVRVTEHRIVTVCCPRCHAVTTGDTPAGVSAPVQYGPVALAVIVYLFTGQYLSRSRTAKALSELFGTPVSAATVSTATSKAAAALGPFLGAVRARIANAPVAHFDETSLRCDKAKIWLHSASTPADTLITAHESRGKIAMDTAGILPAFTGVACHDAYTCYDAYPAVGAHQLCCAHVLRELQAVTDYHTATSPGTWCWAEQATRAITALIHAVDKATTAGKTSIDPDLLADNTRLLHDAALIGAKRPTGNTAERKHRALARRLHNRQDDYLRFATDFTIPATNNPAEQEIRMVKIRQKISGTMRTLQGAIDFADLRSYIATTAKHGLDMLDALTRLTSGNPWQPATT